MRLIYFTLSQSLPKIKFDILSKTMFFSLPIKLIKQFNVIREIFRCIFLWSQKEFFGTELNLKNFSDLLAIFIKQNILLLSTAIEFFIHFNAKHHEDVSQTAFSEFFGRNTVETNHGLDVVFICRSFFRFELN